jgi:tetratricopeptide (TPR) repeat protein
MSMSVMGVDSLRAGAAGYFSEKTGIVAKKRAEVAPRPPEFIAAAVEARKRSVNPPPPAKLSVQGVADVVYRTTFFQGDIVVGRMKASVIGAAAIFGALSFPVAAKAAIAVFGGGEGEACWRAAVASVLIHMDSAVEEARWKADSINLCDLAISGPELNRQDLASTWVNRGILEMSREGYRKAEDNFREALKISPKLAEAHVDLGSTMINLHRYEEGIAETQTGIALNSKEIERAYYNLGIAYEFLGKLQEAYDSYKKAAELKPTWQDPKDQMARFVTQPVNLQK